MGADFQFNVPLRFFEKAEGPKSERMRIAGVVSTDKWDKQKERVLQDGLDFSYFNNHGWFNDNHKGGADNVLGYPDKSAPPRRFSKGQMLPDGTVAEANCTWAEGYLLDTARGRKVWENGQALQGTDRSLGFSVEGAIQRRIGADRKTIAKARVSAIAITECPVGYGTKLMTLAKSLAAAAEDEMDEKEMEDDVEKAMTAGSDASPPATQGPKTGEGAGRLVTEQSLEDDDRKLAKADEEEVEDEPEMELPEEDEEDDEDEMEKSLNVTDVSLELWKRFPEASANTIESLSKALINVGTAPKENTMSQQQLEKALATLLGTVEADSPANQLDALMAKSKAGTATPEETDALIKALGGKSGLSAEVAQDLEPSDSMAKALNVTSYLADQHDGIVTAFATITDHLAKSDAADHQFKVAMAQSMVALSKSLSALGEQIDALGNAPASLQKSMSGPAGQQPAAPAAAPVERAVNGQPTTGEKLSKAQVLEAMDTIARKNNNTSAAGESMSTAIAKYEMTGMLSKSLAAEVKQVAKEQRQAN